MKTNLALNRPYSPPVFLFLVPLISLAIALFIPLPTVAIALLMILIPAAIAIVLTTLTEGRESAFVLLRKLFQWRIGLSWYAVAIFIPIGIILVVGLLAFLVGWTPAVQIHVPAISQLIFNAVFILLVAVLEEFGWRGYALPRLLARRSPLTASLMIGIAWGILHLGIGLLDGRPWLPTLLAPLGISVVLTWLFLHTRGSLAMAILFHFTMDYAPQFLYGLTAAQAVWLQAIVVPALALMLFLLLGVNLQRSPEEMLAVVDVG